MRMPIFPLKVFLLPEGKMRLRIFEPKYIKMISIASAIGGFVIKPIYSKPVNLFLGDEAKTDTSVTNTSLLIEASTKNSEHWGSYVEIEDFNQGSDGVLEIDVLCINLVEINNEKTEHELLYGECVSIQHWSDEEAEPDLPLSELASSLDEVIIQDNMLSTLYQNRQLRNQTWVIARWLELLPVNIAVKGAFINQHGFKRAKGFVESIIYK